MTRPHLGPDERSSRLSLVVAFLLALALMVALLAVLLAMGILRFGSPDRQAVVSPTPVEQPTGALTTGQPTDGPTAPATGAPSTPAGGSPAPTDGTRPTPGGIHIVQPGEDLFSIGELYGVSYAEIAAANELEDPNLLQVGQELVIPLPGATPPPAGNVHVVQPGESVSSIAEQYGVSPTALAEANGLEDWNLIYVGQELIIPGLEESPSPSP